MTTQKFVLSNNYFKASSKLVALTTNFDNLAIAPNFNNFFFFNKKSVGSVISLYNSILKSHFGYYSILHVKGIGFKVFYFAKRHSLYFSLGYNHIVKYNLSREVSVKVRKQYLLFFSHNKALLGTSIYQIQHLRFPDPYRGKGIRFRFQIIAFKPGKQR
jgi:large subunit ribosomal protein L6